MSLKLLFPFSTEKKHESESHQDMMTGSDVSVIASSSWLITMWVVTLFILCLRTISSLRFLRKRLLLSVLRLTDFSLRSLRYCLRVWDTYLRHLFLSLRQIHFSIQREFSSLCIWFEWMFQKRRKYFANTLYEDERGRQEKPKEKKNVSFSSSSLFLLSCLRSLLGFPFFWSYSFVKTYDPYSEFDRDEFQRQLLRLRQPDQSFSLTFKEYDTKQRSRRKRGKDSNFIRSLKLSSDAALSLAFHQSIHTDMIPSLGKVERTQRWREEKQKNEEKRRCVKKWKKLNWREPKHEEKRREEKPLNQTWDLCISI